MLKLKKKICDTRFKNMQTFKEERYQDILEKRIPWVYRAISKQNAHVC